MKLVDKVSDLFSYAIFTGLTGERVDPHVFLKNPPERLKTTNLASEKEIDFEKWELKEKIKRQEEYIEKLKIKNDLKNLIKIKKKEQIKSIIIEELISIIGEENFWKIEISKINNIVDRIYNHGSK